MAADPLSATIHALRQVSQLQELTKVGGLPAIFVGWAPVIARPYVLVNYRSFPTETPSLRSGPMTIDVFTDGPSTAQAERIKDAIIQRLDSQVLPDEEHYYRFSEAQDDGPAPTEANDVAHWTTTFNVRYYRTAFLKARYGP